MALPEVIDSVLKRFKVEATTCYDPAIHILADRERIAEVFSNLIRNSIESTDEAVKIEIETKKEKDFVKIRFADRGKGIAKEDRKRIFEPFFTTKEEGAGLGLAIVKSVLEAHQGKIEVKSRKGRGCEFIIRLPLRRQDA
ncbi:MAG: ATP-binding protein [bacterium]